MPRKFKSLCIYTGSNDAMKVWNGSTTALGGSETMAIKLAEQFANKFRYKVVVYCKCTSPTEDLSGEVNGVLYLPISNFDKDIQSKQWDIVIISRYANKLFQAYESKTVQKVYLWLHDIVPQCTSFPVCDKLKAIFCLSEWHKTYFCQQFNMEPERVFVTRNAINTILYEDNTKQYKKVPNQFIYSSCPTRGLKRLIDMWPRIKANISTATLKIFTNMDFFTDKHTQEEKDKLMQYISEHPEITLSPRIPQEQLAKEYLQSDYWLYPTDWPETYCITALEAQASGCLVMCTKLASLPETVGNRGMVIEGDKDEEKFQENFLSELAFINRNPDLKKIYSENARFWGLNQGYATLAEEWVTKYFQDQPTEKSLE